MKTFFDYLFFWLQWPLILLIIPSLLAPYIPPKFSTIPALINLLFPFLFIALLVILIYGVIRFKWRFIPIVIISLLSWSAIQKTVAFNFNASKEDASSSFKVMSFNAKSFGRYSRDSVKEKHIELMKSEEPDIVSLQEFHSSHSEGNKSLNLIKESLGLEYHYLKPSDFNQKNGRFYGIALLSRYPIFNKGYLDFEDHQANGALFADILHNSDTLRVVNAHLQSVNLIDQPMGDHQSELKGLFTRNFLTKLNRLRTGFTKRALQIEKIQKIITESPHPVIFCGDFNDTPLSYSYRQMTINLKDAFLESGNGFGATYAGPLPLLRIDYILLDPKLGISNFKVLNQKLSDHHPVVCTITNPSP